MSAMRGPHEPGRTTHTLRQPYRAAGVQFIKIERDLAISFCETAITAERADRAVRHLANTRKASLAAMRFIRQLRISDGTDNQRDLEEIEESRVQ
jgi:hypothetical protein